MKELFRLIFSFDFEGLFRKPSSNSWIRFFRYCFVGGFAFVIDFACYSLLIFAGLNYLLSAFIAFVVSFCFNFLISRYFIFSTDSTKLNPSKELSGVLIVAVLGMLLTELLLWLFCGGFGFNQLWAKIIVSALVLIWNYIGRAVFVYRNE